MQVPLQITVRNLRRSESLDARIQEKVAKLERFHPRITSCRVWVEKLSRQHQQGNTFSVRIDVHVPEHEIVVNREQDEDLNVAVREAFDAARRKLEDMARVQRREVKAHEVPATGTIVRLFADDLCGFIRDGAGSEFYFGRENVADPPFEHLKVGDEVHFIRDMADEGLQAKRVTRR
ncbi:MAG TPA: HPF/RaiA family ribosome-associated protein [Burkholderiaceae bacterium]|nr:HPF/RaiA family ribosome-associated protein [Burkholderiaceae bacterium]